MAAKFIRIPYGTRLTFPAICPFSGAKSPKSSVVVSGKENQMILPIPAIGIFKLGQKGRVKFPASVTIGLGDRLLKGLFWALLFGALIISIVRKEDPNAIRYLLGGVVAAYATHLFHWLWLRKVRVIRIGMSSLEVRFSSGDYAAEFCRLNDLKCSDQPSQKRAKPITVNDVG
jgi:hypothetical protein